MFMHYWLIILSVVVLIGTQSHAQELSETEKICTLESVLEENSGLVSLNGHLWTHNDSGNSNELFCVDTAGCSVLRTVEISNAFNTDWEDICADEHYVYVGDFGNNNGDRTDLCIYKISRDFTLHDSIEHIETDSITFYYPNQQQFEWENYSTNFDCEAMIADGDSLYLFSKNWGNLKTYLYTLPKVPGEYPAILQDSFNVEGLITGAAIDTVENQITLIGYNQYMTSSFIYLLDSYQGNCFFNGNVTKLKPGLSLHQTEGIELNNGDIVLSNETFSSNPAALYRTSLVYDYNEPILSTEITPGFYPNPAENSFRIINCKAFDRLTIKNIRGRIMLETDLQSDSIRLPLYHLQSGTYIIELRGSKTSFADILIVE
jgi:hypothetical protein